MRSIKKPGGRVFLYLQSRPACCSPVRVSKDHVSKRWPVCFWTKNSHLSSCCDFKVGLSNARGHGRPARSAITLACMHAPAPRCATVPLKEGTGREGQGSFAGDVRTEGGPCHAHLTCMAGGKQSEGEGGKSSLGCIAQKWDIFTLHVPCGWGSSARSPRRPQESDRRAGSRIRHGVPIPGRIALPTTVRRFLVCP